MLDKIVDAVNGIGETGLTIGGFVIGMLIGGMILMASLKGARSRYEESFAEWEEEEKEVEEEVN